MPVTAAIQPTRIGLFWAMAGVASSVPVAARPWMARLRDSPPARSVWFVMAWFLPERRYSFACG